jgi:hypothetical protein
MLPASRRPLLAVAGCADVTSAVFRSTIMQPAVPYGLRERLMAVQKTVVTWGRCRVATRPRKEMASAFVITSAADPVVSGV